MMNTVPETSIYRDVPAEEAFDAVDDVASDTEDAAQGDRIALIGDIGPGKEFEQLSPLAVR